MSATKIPIESWCWSCLRTMLHGPQREPRRVQGIRADWSALPGSQPREALKQRTTWRALSFAEVPMRRPTGASDATRQGACDANRRTRPPIGREAAHTTVARVVPTAHPSWTPGKPSGCGAPRQIERPGDRQGASHGKPSRNGRSGWPPGPRRPGGGGSHKVDTPSFFIGVMRSKMLNGARPPRRSNLK